MKSLKERIIFKRVDKISPLVNLELFNNKDITIELLYDLIKNQDIFLSDYFYEKDVSGTIHSMRDSIEFKELMVEMINAIKEYRKTGYLCPINTPKKSNNKYKKSKIS